MNKNEELLKLKSQMLKDEKLPLKKGATNLVFGVGNPDTKILFIGEGPGYWEDQKAEPFVGNAGKLLNQLLQLIELKREDVYITNVVHHRPPDNRDPLPEEIEAYKPYLDKIIEVIDPKVIVTLGRFSMGKFLPGVKITSVHGKIHEVNWMGKEIIIMPMYHPAAALRNPEVMRQIRDDFQKLPEILKEANKVDVKQMQLV
ncbi:MAG: uracil-DNA glycosylase [Patescibacteria group bacterium]